jgi:tRNA A37 threonylcarbamoyladenosine synthetase subunit TsaC/SUA5/YrdC
MFDMYQRATEQLLPEDMSIVFRDGAVHLVDADGVARVTMSQRAYRLYEDRLMPIGVTSAHASTDPGRSSRLPAVHRVRGMLDVFGDAPGATGDGSLRFGDWDDES